MIRDALCHGIKLTLIKLPNMALTLSEHQQDVMSATRLVNLRFRGSSQSL